LVRLRRAGRLGLAIAALAAAIVVPATASAAGNTLSFDPPTSNVAAGATLDVKVMQDVAVPTSGTAVTFTFNKSVLQIASITRGPAFATAPLFLAGDAGAISNANKSGKLSGIAVAFFPPGSVPAGSQLFLTITFKAVGCGSSPLTFALSKKNDGLLDGRDKTYGAALKVDKTTNASVQVCEPGASVVPGSVSFDPNASFDAGASPSFDASASPSFDASASEAPSAVAAGGVVTPSQPPAAGSGGTTDEQSSWLTFALAGLAVAAAGLALLIVVIVLITIVAATVAAYYLLRAWRRSLRGSPQPEAAAASAPAAEPQAATDTAADPGAVESPRESPGVGAPAPNPSAG
jgi:hypothetical protein